MINLAQQYQDDEGLQTRQETHRSYTVGQPLEVLVDQALQLEGHESLLDVGTATGDFPARLRLEGHTGCLVGLDFSGGMIQNARATHHGMEFVQGDAMQLPCSNSSFDAVTARHMLYYVPHVRHIRQALLEAKRVLRPSGRFLAVANTGTSPITGMRLETR